MFHIILLIMTMQSTKATEYPTIVNVVTFLAMIVMVHSN